MKKLTLKLAVLTIWLVVLSACQEANVNKYVIIKPANKGDYVGTESAPPALGASSTTQLPDVFKVTYSKPPSGDVDIILNGQKIGQHFSYSATEATANISAFKQFLRQGQNTLSVAPLAFGPTIAFTFDNAGPDIIITKGEYSPASGTPTQVTIEGKLRDPSAINTLLEVDLTQTAGYTATGAVIKNFIRTKNLTVQPDGTFSSVIYITDDDLPAGDSLLIADDSATTNVNEQRSLLYDVKAKDQYGYDSQKSFISDSVGSDTIPVQSGVRVAVGDTFIESLRPIIASSLYESLKKAPFDVRFVCTAGLTDPAPGQGCGKVKQAVSYANGNSSGEQWENSKADKTKNCPDGAAATDPCWTDDGNDGLRLGGGINPLTVDFAGAKPAILKQIYLSNGGNVAGGPTGVGTVLLNRLKLKENNLLNLDLAVTEIVASLSIQLLDLGFLGTCDINVETYIKRMLINGDIKVQAIDKDVTVEFQNGASFSIPEDLRFGSLSACGLNVTGIGNAIANPIKGLVANLLPGLLNGIFKDNLEKLIIGGRLTQTDSGSQMDVLLNIAQMGTKNLLGPGNPYDMFIELESVANLLTTDSYVNPALGPVFYEDPIPTNDVLNSLGGNGTNLSVAVNSNMINQMLNAGYGMGIMHFTNYKGTMYYGANPQTPANASDPTQTTASLGDTRIRLWPNMTPRLNFASRDGSTGGAFMSMTYDSAVLYSDKMVDLDGDGPNTDIGWETQFSLDVTFDLKVLINEVDGVFEIGSAGPPTLKILKVQNNTSFQVPQSLMQSVVDAALLFGGNLLADRTLKVDLNKIIEGTLSGKEVRFMSDKDEYTIPDSGGEPGCITYAENGQVILPAGATATSDNANDLVCQTINFVAKTNTAGVIGGEGRNLFLQLEVRDPNIPPAPALPRFDLDNDGVVDYKDNCAAGTSDVAQAINAVLIETVVAPFNEFNGTLDDNIWNAGKKFTATDKDPNNNCAVVGASLDGVDVPESLWGVPKCGFEDAVKKKLHVIIKQQFNGVDPVAADATYYNAKRTGDAPISIAGAEPWIELLYKNASQTNGDANSTQNDRVGDLCEADADKDLVFSDYNDDPGQNDNCPGVYNPKVGGVQPDADGNGLGDACDVKNTYVLIRSLGAAYTNASNPAVKTGDFKCLSHEHFTNTNTETYLAPNAYLNGQGDTDFEGNGSGVQVSRDMNELAVASGNTGFMVDCNPADVNQRWYIQSYAPSTTSGLLPSPRKEAQYQIFASETRNNATDWQLVNYLKFGFNPPNNDAKRVDANLRMAIMGNATKIQSQGNDERSDLAGAAGNPHGIYALWILGLDPAASSGDLGTSCTTGTEAERQACLQNIIDSGTHPWVIRPGEQQLYNTWSCLFYNLSTGGWGPDIDPEGCTSTYTNGVSTPSASGSSEAGAAKLYRYGIFIKGTQLWNGVY